jgi:hypothetical protein
MLGVIYWRYSGVKKLTTNKQIGFIGRKHKYLFLSRRKVAPPENVTACIIKCRDI